MLLPNSSHSRCDEYLSSTCTRESHHEVAKQTQNNKVNQSATTSKNPCLSSNLSIWFLINQRRDWLSRAEWNKCHFQKNYTKLMHEINSNRSVWSSKCGDMIIGSTLRSSQGAQISWKPWESPLEHVRRKHYIVEISFGIVPTFRVATTTNINTRFCWATSQFCGQLCPCLLTLDLSTPKMLTRPCPLLVMNI